MTWANFHTHTIYCDGAEIPENYVKEAVRQKMIELGFSAHAPVPFENVWSIRTSFDLENYCAEIQKLKNEYSDRISIYHALEIDFIPGLSENFHLFKKNLKLDYAIGSVHLVKNVDNDGLWFIDGPVNNFDSGLNKVFNNDIRKGVTSFFHQSVEMVEKEKPDIIGHLDKIKMNNQGRFFRETDEWYIELILELLEVVKKNGTIVEINTRGIYKKRYTGLYPDTWVIKYCLKENIPLMLNSDAHKPQELTCYFRETAILLKQIGVKELMIRMNDEWKNVGFDEEGYEL